VLKGEVTTHPLSNPRLQLLHLLSRQDRGRTIDHVVRLDRDTWLGSDVELVITGTLKDEDVLPYLNMIIRDKNMPRDPRTVHIETIGSLQILEPPGVIAIGKERVATRDERVVDPDVRIVSAADGVLTIHKIERLLFTPTSKNHQPCHSTASNATLARPPPRTPPDYSPLVATTYRLHALLVCCDAPVVILRLNPHDDFVVLQVTGTTRPPRTGRTVVRI
jgi:hypothetical protein